MSKVFSPQYPMLDINNSQHFITQDVAKRMSKYRVIQKNLVHVQGFPDSISECLENYEFLGQYGQITKMVIVKGKDEEYQGQIKKSNSAYATFSTYEEAAFAVLAVDSIYYDNHYIRAFFGTSKYCIHFLNNKECYNKEKCMYLHYLASEEDVLGNTCGVYSKFDYSEHLQIALTTSAVLLKEKKEMILKAKYPWSVFPNIKNIYNKDIVIQAEKRQLDLVLQLQLNHTNSNINNVHHNSNNKSNSNNNSNKGSTRTSTNDEDTTSKSSEKCSENSHYDQDNYLFHYRTQSRFYNDTKMDIHESTIVPFHVIDLIDKISSRYSFFKHFNRAKNEYKLFKQNSDNQLNDSWSEFINSNMKLFENNNDDDK